MWIYLWSTLVICPYFAIGYLNVFISHKEMLKLMGIEAELFYVREGVVNTYAMQFVVPVQSAVDDLEFSWHSLIEIPLPYVISIDYDTHDGVLQPPKLTIPTHGLVPRQIQKFSIHLQCSGNASAEVPLSINVFVHGPYGHNDTRLHFKRNKICLEGVSSERNLAPAAAPPQGPALLGAAGCALGLVLVVGLIASAMYVRARKQIRQDSLHTSFTTAAYGSHQNVFIRLDPLGRPPSANSGSYATIASLNKYPLSGESKKSWFRSTSSAPSPYATALLPLAHNQQSQTESIYAKPESVCPSRVSYYASSQLTQVYSLSTPRTNITNIGDSRNKFYRICVPGEAISCQRLIQEGTYSRVYFGQLSHPSHNRKDAKNLLIKSVVDGASLTQVACLLTEASLLCGVIHMNVHAPVAVNTDLPGPPKIAYPFPLKGNLKKFLLSSHTSGVSLSTRQLVEFGLHVARGLTYLHSLGIIHRDVATRNCVLDEDMMVRICDGALAKDLFPDDYHCLGDNENRPIKWMALETLQKKYYSAATDVWSLGVMLWELTTLAMMPFEEVDPFELEAYLRDGYRLPQPVNCPDEFYTVMSCCWLADSKQRPAFSQLNSYLQDFYEDLGKYI